MLGKKLWFIRQRLLLIKYSYNRLIWVKWTAKEQEGQAHQVLLQHTSSRHSASFIQQDTEKTWMRKKQSKYAVVSDMDLVVACVKEYCICYSVLHRGIRYFFTQKYNLFCVFSGMCLIACKKNGLGCEEEHKVTASAYTWHAPGSGRILEPLCSPQLHLPQRDLQLLCGWLSAKMPLPFWTRAVWHPSSGIERCDQYFLYQTFFYGYFRFNFILFHFFHLKIDKEVLHFTRFDFWLSFRDRDP